MSYAELDRVLHEGRQVVLAADQRTFESSGRGGTPNTFTVLVPLMTVDGERFSDPERTFPNRGRIWWMLTPQHKAFEIEAGAIFTAVLETGMNWDPTDPMKDRYQVKRHTIGPGAPDWHLVLTADRPVADAAELMRIGVPCPHPAPSSVVVECGGDLIGPFRAEWDKANRRANLSATFAGDPRAYRLEASRAGAEAAPVADSGQNCTW